METVAISPGLSYLPMLTVACLQRVFNTSVQYLLSANIRYRSVDIGYISATDKEIHVSIAADGNFYQIIVCGALHTNKGHVMH